VVFTVAYSFPLSSIFDSNFLILDIFKGKILNVYS
jgi:hypothetical protein